MTRRIFLPSESDIYRDGLPYGKLYTDVHRERIRAHAKHDGNSDSMERIEWDDPAWLPVLVEEAGEVARELCEIRHRGYISDSDMIRLREELVQLAAMACAWIDAIDNDESQLIGRDPMPQDDDTKRAVDAALSRRRVREERLKSAQERKEREQRDQERR